MAETNTGSPLLSSGLSEDELAEHVLTFLDRESVKQVLVVNVLCQSFRLTKYYCPQHGEKLEAVDVSLENKSEDNSNITESTSDEKHQATADNGQEGRKDGLKRKEHSWDLEDEPRCKDCLFFKLYGKKRCSRCGGFDLEDDMQKCADCERTTCVVCYCGEPFFAYSGGFCVPCGKYYCGQDNCSKVFSCGQCRSDSCMECDPNLSVIFCSDCGETHGCRECWRGTYQCFRCECCQEVFCYGCRLNRYCDDCGSEVCGECRESYHCRCGRLYPILED